MAETAEAFLSRRDRVLREIIDRDSSRWPSAPDPNPIWGLVRIVIAQQISTAAALKIVAKVAVAAPDGRFRSSSGVHVDPALLVDCGLTRRKAQCCSEIFRRGAEFMDGVAAGAQWEDILAGVSGIGPWTIAIFKIMVLRQPDVLPTGDLGLVRAVKNNYGERAIERLQTRWKPYRSVACWYLWRSLGNPPLG